MPEFKLISHVLCPYVQRSAIVLMEKNVRFSRENVDLSNKPQWFLSILPTGKTPVLKVNDDVIFESSVICEYLDETIAPRLHPEDPLLRAQHRAWMEFGSTILNTIGTFYTTADEDEMEKAAQKMHQQFMQIECVLGDGPYFSNHKFSVVDAVFGPVFRYFDFNS